MTHSRPVSDDQAGPSATGLTRRTVVRTAGKAAWAAPVIVAVTAAPAFALSGVDVNASAIGGSRPGGNLRISVTLTNIGTVAATSLTVSVNLQPDDTGDLFARLGPTPQNVTAGWTVSSTGGNYNRTYTFVRAAGLGVGLATTLTFDPKTPTLGLSPAGTGDISVATPVTAPTSVNNTGGAGTYPA